MKGLFGGADVATGVFTVSAIAVVVYAIIALVLLWPLVFALIRKVLPPKATAAVEAIEHEAEPLPYGHHHHADGDAADHDTPALSKEKK